MLKRLKALAAWLSEKWNGLTPEQRARIESNARRLSERVLKDRK